MKIKSIRTRAVAAPMKRPLATSTGALTASSLLLVDLRTDSGIVGRSYLFGIGQHNLKPIAALVEAMAQMLQGDAVAPCDIEKKLRARYTLLGVHNIVLFAMSGIDMAAWDVIGQAQQLRSCVCSAARRARFPPTTPRASASCRSSPWRRRPRSW